MHPDNERGFRDHIQRRMIRTPPPRMPSDMRARLELALVRGKLTFWRVLAVGELIIIVILTLL